MRRIKLLCLAIALTGSLSAHAASPSIDCVTSCGSATTSSANNVTATLSTAQTNDEICALPIAESLNAQGAAAVSSFTAGALAFTKRIQVQSHTGSTQFVDTELWCAPSSGTLSSQTIKVTWSITPDSAGLIVFGVNGQTVASPFDPNVSLPAHNDNPGGTGSTVSASGVSTTNKDDLVMFYCSIGQFAERCDTTVPVGFTLATGAFIANGGGTNGSYGAVFYKSVSATQSSITINGSPSSVHWIAIGDAFTADSSAAAGRMMLKSGPGW